MKRPFIAMLVLIALFFVGFFLGCSSSSGSGETTTTTTTSISASSTTTTTNLITSTTVEYVAPQLPPMSETMRLTIEALFLAYGDAIPKTVLVASLDAIPAPSQGPALNHLEYIPSANGLTLEGSSASILDHASVPEAILGHDSKVRLYFVDGYSSRKLTQSIDQVLSSEVTAADIQSLYDNYYYRQNMSLGSATSNTTDGTTLTYDGTFRIIGLSDDFAAVDPSAVLDGDIYKLYFFMVLQAEIPDGGDAPEAEHHMIGVATGEDGSTFTLVGTAYAETVDNTLADPEVFNFNGTYRAFLMANSGTRMVISTNEGATFIASEETILDGVDMTNVKFSDSLVDGAYRMYFGDTNNNFASAYSTDEGATWTLDPNHPRDTDGDLIEGRGAMPAVKLQDGTWKFYHH